MRNAENPTPTWLRFQHLDSALEGTETSLSQGRAKRIPILHTLSQLQDSLRFHKKLQSSSKQFQVAKLPIQWMPFPQYPQHYRIRILHPEHPEPQGHPPGATKEFYLQGLDYQNDISSSTSDSDSTVWERLIRSHSLARFCFELSRNSN